MGLTGKRGRKKQMEQERLVRIEQDLLRMKGEETARALRMKEGLRTPQGSSVEELSVYDNHPGDIGDVTFEREKDLGLVLFTEDRLAMINDALSAIREGTYGYCRFCGREISAERLEAIPYTVWCQECKRQHEEQGRAGRPVEEEVMELPFGGLQDFHAQVDNNAFDGEDAWQAVARYGTSNSPSDLGSVLDYDDMYLHGDENIGSSEAYEQIVTRKGKDGQHYQVFR
jgi:YteA family regulatory protein